jgi:hypothetical protein
VSPASRIHSLPWRSAALFSCRRCRLSSLPGGRQGADRSAAASADSTAAAIAGQSGDVHLLTGLLGSRLRLRTVFTVLTIKVVRDRVTACKRSQ